MIITIRKGTSVNLTSHIVEMIEAHARDAVDYYSNKNNRSVNQKMEHIIRGKMAEYGYWLICKNIGIVQISEPDLKNHKNGDDGGFDFKLNGVKVDVKSLDTTKRGYHQMPVSEGLRAEAYVLCWVDMKNKTVIYDGAITREKIGTYGLLEEGKNPITGKPYKYVNKNHLKELNENFE